MKKNILIIGRQGSGKTTKANKLLSNYNKPLLTVLMKFKFPISEIEKNFDVVCIEEICDNKAIESLIEKFADIKTDLIITTQLDINEISTNVLEKCNVVQLNKVLFSSCY